MVLQYVINMLSLADALQDVCGVLTDTLLLVVSVYSRTLALCSVMVVSVRDSLSVCT
jgi:hypothetical protein